MGKPICLSARVWKKKSTYAYNETGAVFPAESERVDALEWVKDANGGPDYFYGGISTRGRPNEMSGTKQGGGAVARRVNAVAEGQHESC